jgi:hypothetical protein
VGSGGLDGGRGGGNRSTRRFTEVHVPSVEDRYILLAIYTIGFELVKALFRYII